MTEKAKMVQAFIRKRGILVVVILCLFSRLPLILSDSMILDGDESIIGLMSKHFIEGKEFPFFFYGQSYGFSFLEVLSISVFYLLFGVSAVSVKLGMLLLFTLGIIFFYKTLLQLKIGDNYWLAFLVCLIFILSPSFAIWSLKARGGYLTSFFLSSLVTYLIFNKNGNFKNKNTLFIGFLLVIIFESQPFWLAGLTPIVVYYLSVNFSLKKVLILIVGFFSTALFFGFLKQGLSDYWLPPMFSMNNFDIEGFATIPKLIYVHFSGTYFYDSTFELSFFQKIFSFVLSLIVFVSIFFGIVHLFKNRNIRALPFVLTCSVIATLLYIPLMHAGNYRYLLPLTGFVLMLIFVLIQDSKFKKVINGFSFFTIILASISSFSLFQFEPESKKEILHVISELKQKKVQYVFCEGGLLQWQIMFYSNEEIIARFKNSEDRYPKYVDQVNTAQKDSTKSKALVTEEILIIDKFRKQRKSEWAVVGSPSDSLLISRGFAF